ncbi:hypothetical protein [Leptolyngbya sp. Heron Island J]|uniref:hypothetical protein n=1 Tax=Leptolyngbya sp. Heron Island J TaxID=1385935 RepID=UPI000403F13B|nr:hypothetical protein [Leptolyngbya sp. Heron Island J]
MKTLTQSPVKGLEITQSSDSQHHVTWNGHVVGLIQTHPSLGLNWEYGRYSAYPNTFIGSYEQCCDRALSDYSDQHPTLQSPIVAITA